MDIPGILEQGCARHLKDALSADGDLDIDASVSLRSIAFSLKRIADGLEHSPSGGISHILDAMLDSLSEIASALHPEERK
jgi:hypothetical protein